MEKRGLNNRGQITIFIIIAIVIVVTGILFFVFNKSVSKPVAGDIGSLRDSIDSCLKTVSDRGILKIGEQGGYYNLPNASLYYFPYLTFFYLKNGENLVLSKDVVEKQIGFYIDDNLPLCFSENLKQFETQGFNFSYENIKSSALIKENSVDINSKINLFISKGNSVSRIDEISYNAKPIRLLTLLDLSNKIINQQLKDTRSICVSCLSQDAKDNGVLINVYKTPNKNDFVYVISDPLSNFSNSAYNFTFAAEYKFLICKTAEDCLNELSK